MEEKKLHYKMYKDGKKFVCAAIATLSFFVFGGVPTVAVHADTTSGNLTTATVNSTSDTASGTEATSGTGAASGTEATSGTETTGTPESGTTPAAAEQATRQQRCEWQGTLPCPTDHDHRNN